MRSHNDSPKADEGPRFDRLAGGATPRQWEPLRASVAYWTLASKLAEIWWTRSAGRSAIEAACANRFRAIVAHARAHSPLYRDAYRGLPLRGFTPADVPVVTKRELMARFDDWATDRAITLEPAAPSSTIARESASAASAATSSGRAPEAPACPASTCRTTKRWRRSTR